MAPRRAAWSFLQDRAIFGWHGRCSYFYTPALTETPLKALMWSTVAAVAVCACHGREVQAISPPPLISSAAATKAIVSANVGRRDTEVEGTMVAVKGSCPVMTFSVAGTTIWMDSTTVLNGLSCAQLVNGTIVRVSGLRRQDGSMLANTISAQRR